MSTDSQPTHAASAESESQTHVVAIDGSEDADRAFRWAVRNLVRGLGVRSLSGWLTRLSCSDAAEER